MLDRPTSNGSATSPLKTSRRALRSNNANRNITLGFAPAAAAAFVPRARAHRMSVDRVVLARLGRLGRVEEVLM